MPSLLFRSGTLCRISFVWILHSFCHWFLFKWTVMKTEFEAYDGAIPWMEFLILLPMGVIQILCSRIVDSCPIFQMMITWLILAILPFLFTLESIPWLVMQQFLHGCGAALIIPTTSKFFASVYSGRNLNFVFCILKFSEINVKIFARISDKLNFRGMDSYQKMWITLVGSSAVISLLSLILTDKIDKPWFSPKRHGMWKSPLVIDSALCVMLLKFSEEMVMHSETMRMFIPHFRGSQIFTELLIGSSGFIGGLAICFCTISGGNRVAKHFYILHLCYCVLLLICIGLVQLSVMDIGIPLLFLGLQLSTPEIFLSGPMALRYGEGSGATAVGIVHGSGNLGQAFALAVLYFVPGSMITYAAILSLCLCAILFRNLRDSYNKYMDDIFNNYV